MSGLIWEGSPNIGDMPMYIEDSTEKLAKLDTSKVCIIQQHLIDLGLLEYPVDGIPGPKTHAAWAKFKRSLKLVSLDSVSSIDTDLLKEYASIITRINDSPAVTKKELNLIFGRLPTNRQVKDFNECLLTNEITSIKRITHFLAQVAHESGGLRWLKEIADGSAYEYRKDLGNTQPGDGPKYKGGGALQLTGKFNYQKFAYHVGDQRVMEGCDYVAEYYPFSSAGWYWTTRNLNKLCDEGASVAAITKVINGGYRGLQDRIAYYERAKNVLLRERVIVLD